MKPKAALKRTPIVTDAASARVSMKQKSETPRGRLTLLPKLETNTPYHPWVGASLHYALQSWFRKYDVSGRVVEEGLYVDEEPLFRWIYSYTASGKKAQAFLLDGGQRLLEKRFYDDAEQLTRKIVFAANGTREQIEYQSGTSQISHRRSGLLQGLVRAA